MKPTTKKIVILGAGGQVATELVREFSDQNVFPLSHEELDITNGSQVEERLTAVKPQVVINTAAYHRVDECESHPEEAFRVNAIAVGELAQICRSLEATLVHFSTDYVFRGDQERPYREDDLPGPLSVYAASKLAGEHLVQAYASKYLIIRTCGVYGRASRRGKGYNFVELILAKGGRGEPIRVVDDQVLTPTYAVDLAREVKQLIEREHQGLFHVTSGGQCSWFDFARKIFDLAGLKAKLSPVTSAELAAPARRPLYSVLAHARLCNLGLDDLPIWEDALLRYLEARSKPPRGI